MSQASKQVEWCLRKAEKEISECKRLGIRERHRGILKGEQNLEEAKNHIAKAESNLKSAIDFDKIGHSDWSINAFFYSFYHCFLSIGYKFGYESCNQSCTVSLMQYLKENGKINMDSKYIEMFKYESEAQEDSIIEMREDYTYGTKTEASREKIEELTKLCKELIEITKKIVYGQLKP